MAGLFLHSNLKDNAYFPATSSVRDPGYGFKACALKVIASTGNQSKIIMPAYRTSPRRHNKFCASITVRINTLNHIDVTFLNFHPGLARTISGFHPWVIHLQGSNYKT
jgi:hypothetical protein